MAPPGTRIVTGINAGAHVSVHEKAKVQGGTLLARTPRKIAKTKDITGGLPRVAELFEARRPKDAAASRYLDNTANTRGKPAIAVEAGYAGTTHTDDIELLANGCFNVMRYLKMLPGSVSPVQNPVWIESVQTVASDQNGIFYPLVERGTYVVPGMKIGTVTDYTGRTILEARAPVSGIILYICAVPSISSSTSARSRRAATAARPRHSCPRRNAIPLTTGEGSISRATAI